MVNPIINVAFLNNRLKFIDDNKARAGKAGAIDVILEVMKKHMNNWNVCYSGCGAIKNITANGKCSQ